MPDRDGWADAEYWKQRAERAEALADQLAEALRWHMRRHFTQDTQALKALAAWEEARRDHSH